MLLEGVRGYLQLASGLTDVTKERARATARALLAQGEAGVGAVVPETMRVQVTALAEELLATSRANRDLLLGLIRAEADRAVARLGLALAAQLEAATARAQDLEDRVYELERELRVARLATPAATPPKTTATKAAPGKHARKSTPAKSTVRKAAPAKAAKKAAPAKASTKKTAPAPSPPSRPAATPRTTPSATPRTTPSATPRTTPSATPGTTPSATPETTPPATPPKTPPATPPGTPPADPNTPSTNPREAGP